LLLFVKRLVLLDDSFQGDASVCFVLLKRFLVPVVSLAHVDGLGDRPPVACFWLGHRSIFGNFKPPCVLGGALRAEWSEFFLLNGFRFGNFHFDSAAVAVTATANTRQNASSADREIFTAIPPTNSREGARRELAAFTRHDKGGECPKMAVWRPDQFSR